MNSQIVISDSYRTTLSELALDTAERVFGDSRLRVWRDLEDRDNSTFDATLASGKTVRLHVKRDKRKRREPMALEARGILLLNAAKIPSAPLVAHGSLGDRTFVITENLDSYVSADRLMETDVDRKPIVLSMAEIASRLHRAGLHHRDLYANHFYLRPQGGGYDVRLIDTARVRPLPWFFRERWIVKDVAQLIFSVQPYAAHEDHIATMLKWYERQTRRPPGGRFERRVRAKAAWIERHDRALREKKPSRNLRLADGN